MKYFSKETYIARRAELRKRVGSGLLVFIGNGEVGMNYRDNGYAFRQDSTMLYYFGSDYADMCALIDIDADGEIIFADELTIDDIVWMGDMPTKREMSALVGVEPAGNLNPMSAPRSRRGNASTRCRPTVQSMSRYCPFGARSRRWTSSWRWPTCATTRHPKRWSR